MSNEIEGKGGSDHPGESLLAWFGIWTLVLWTVLVVVVVQGVTLYLAWAGDVSKMPASAQSYLAYGLLQPLLVGVPCLLLVPFLKSLRPAAILRSMLWTVLATVLLLLPRALLPPEMVAMAGIARAITGCLVGGYLWLQARRRGHLQWRITHHMGLAILLAMLFLWPWLLYGALGDLVDVALAVMQALGLALLATGLAATLMPSLRRDRGPRHRDMWLGGVILATLLLAIAGSWGQSDTQAFLMGVLPALGFPLALWGLQDDGYDAFSAVTLVFWVCFGPLAFADPRETRLVFLLLGDSLRWTMQATAVNVLTGGLLALLVGLFMPALTRARQWRGWGVLAIVAAAGAGILYFTSGQVGLFGDHFFIVLRQQADLESAVTITDVAARRAWVYDTLVQTADASQSDLIAWLDSRHLPYKRYYLVNGIEVRAGLWWRWQLGRHPDVHRILYSPNLRPVPEPPPLQQGHAVREGEVTRGLQTIGVDRVWSELGVRGAGIVVGQSDSGVDANHPNLVANYRGKGSDHEFNWYDPWFARAEPYDLHGHGTHTLGTAVGSDGIGVAPDATWFACANLVRPFGNIANYLDCMQFMLAPHPQGGDPLHTGQPDLAADVSTNSWGCPPALEGCDQESLYVATQALRQAGIFFVAASGNEGPACDSMETPPGNYGNVLSVGALDESGDLASFSSRGLHTGSPDDNRTPDLLAPGVNVLSAWPGGGYERLPGTSMATPHVAGVVALMWSANSALRGRIDETTAILFETAQPYEGDPDDCGVAGEYPDSGTGYGVIDAYAAVKRALTFAGP